MLSCAVSRANKGPKREKQGGLSRGPEPSNPYGGDPYNRPVSSNPGYPAAMPQHPGMPPVQAAPPTPADPYAAYGGYQNYVAMWNAASAHYPNMSGQPQ